jgi:hypothetical protein
MGAGGVPAGRRGAAGWAAYDPALVARQDREAFDAGLKAVLDEVRVNLDLGVLNDFVHRWWISARDPDGRQRMHARADQIMTGKSRG